MVDTGYESKGERSSMDTQCPVKVIPLNPEAPHPRLRLDEKKTWTLIPDVQQMPPAMEFSVKAVKFNSPTRICPVHGEVKVVNRKVQRYDMTCTEGLSCGHLLLITRRTGAIKENMPAPYAKHHPRNRHFFDWWFNFKPCYTL